jgi:hypothetical protein
MNDNTETLCGNCEEAMYLRAENAGLRSEKAWLERLLEIEKQKNMVDKYYQYYRPIMIGYRDKPTVLWRSGLEQAPQEGSGEIPSEISPWEPTVEQLKHLIEKYQAVRFHRSAEDSLELCVFKWALAQYEKGKA